MRVAKEILNGIRRLTGPKYAVQCFNRTNKILNYWLLIIHLKRIYLLVLDFNRSETRCDIFRRHTIAW